MKTLKDKSPILDFYIRIINAQHKQILEQEHGIVEKIRQESDIYFSRSENANPSEKEKTDYWINLMEKYQKIYHQAHQILIQAEQKINTLREKYSCL